jgi:CDP-diacylglycerol--serine O-phosphatidyltransferase
MKMRGGARAPARRRGVRRAVVLMPNGLTLFNLFCGIYAIVLAIRGDFAAAPGWIVVGGIADALDGRVARATGTGSRFGEELDSLVDALSFGFAPALIMFLELPNRGTWEWLLVFIFTSCAVMRLARFNVEQAGRKKSQFHGLPSPAAGLTLASYYWFSQTSLYNQTVILFTDSKTLSDLPWHTILRGLMAILAALMISDVPYPAVPSIGFGSIKKVLGTLVIAGCVALLIFRRQEFIFPALLAYVLFGAVKWAILGFLGRSSTPAEIFWEEETDTAPHHAERRHSPSWTPALAGGADALAEAESRDAADAGAESRSDESARQGRRRRRRRGHRGGTRPHGTPPTGSNTSPPPPRPPSTPPGKPSGQGS